MYRLYVQVWVDIWSFLGPLQLISLINKVFQTEELPLAGYTTHNHQSSRSHNVQVALHVHCVNISWTVYRAINLKTKSTIDPPWTPIGLLLIQNWLVCSSQLHTHTHTMGRLYVGPSFRNTDSSAHSGTFITQHLHDICAFRLSWLSTLHF